MTGSIGQGVNYIASSGEKGRAFCGMSRHFLLAFEQSTWYSHTFLYLNKTGLIYLDSSINAVVVIKTYDYIS